MTRSLATLMALSLGGCAVGPAGGAVPAHPTSCMPVPGAASERRAALDAFGRRAFSAMRAGEPLRLLYDDLDLGELVSTVVATRLRARRLDLGPRLHLNGSNIAMILARARYAGVCLQGARSEPASGPLGLRSEGWVFDRALLIGRRRDGQRVAAWLEGVFLFSDAGFAALDLERVEQPRWEHSDLELAPCDLAIRNDLPEIAR